MPSRAIVVLIAAVTAAGVAAGARPAQQSPPAGAGAGTDAFEQQWRLAVDAWDAGRYPFALQNLGALMRSPVAADYRDRVALLTGELFVTMELTTDGRNPRFAPTGRFASYETGPPSKTVTNIVVLDAGGARTVAEVAGVSAAFDKAGTSVTYLRPAQTPDWEAAVNAVEEAATTQERQPAQAAVNYLLGQGSLVVRNLQTGAERALPTGALLKASPMFASDGRSVLFIGADPKDLTRSDVYVVSADGPPAAVTDQPGHKANVLVDPTGAALIYSVTATAPFRVPTPAGAGRGGGGGGGGGGTPQPVNPCGSGAAGGGRGGGTPSFGIVDLKAKATRLVTGSAVTISDDGSTIAWLSRTNDTCALDVAPTLVDKPAVVRSGRDRLDAPALSADGKRVAYQLMTRTDWEVYVSDEAGAQRRLTREIQHDLLPRFLNNDTVLAMKGEARHRRSYTYDLATGTPTRLFANNTIRTISPEYIWLPSADGTRLLIQAERDGDTVSAERGVYLVDLTRKVSVADVATRIDRQRAAENELRLRMTKSYQPLEDQIRTTVDRISATRAYEYEKTQFDFDSKYVSQPGNAKAIEYLNRMYASFGYTPELQWFQPQQAQGNRTANIVSTLKGTENPDLIYVASSHFDSVAVGPGADDDTSGTCALLETARVLANTPMPATIVFASFTGEEAGLLGSRQFVRLAAERKWNIVGALNNDMIGWAGESGRMDNTIRYSNAGIRDLQHGAAFLFSRLITYDAKYYKSTDAQAFYDGWGDIVGGIGSYPVLGNPNYHQPTDLIETINFQQVAETAKVTAATLIYLASSPSRLKDLKAAKTAGGVELTWTPSPEAGVKTYIVAYGPASDPLRTRTTVNAARAALPSLPAGTRVAVKAINARGLEGWDWARTVVQ